MRQIRVRAWENGEERFGTVEILTDPQTFEALEHDLEVTANLDGILLDDGRRVSTQDLEGFDFWSGP